MAVKVSPASKRLFAVGAISVVKLPPLRLATPWAASWAQKADCATGHLSPHSRKVNEQDVGN